ncbi:TPA: hypothetical protein ACI7GS_005040, partial [Escherichia coli]
LISLKVCQRPYSVGVHPTAIAQTYNIVRFPNAAQYEEDGAAALLRVFSGNKPQNLAVERL